MGLIISVLQYQNMIFLGDTLPPKTNKQNTTTTKNEQTKKQGG